MSWRPHFVVRKTASKGTGVKVSLRKIKATGQATMIVSMSDTVAIEVGFKAGDLLELLVGEGDHHGLLRLRPSTEGSVEVIRQGLGPGKSSKESRGDKGYFSLRLGTLTQFVQRSEGGRWAQWEKVEDGWVEVVLPSWADETGPRRKLEPPNVLRPPPAAVPARVAEAAYFQRPRRNVTASLMGDPDPNHRKPVDP